MNYQCNPAKKRSNFILKFRVRGEVAVKLLIFSTHMPDKDKGIFFPVIFFFFLNKGREQSNNVLM